MVLVSLSLPGTNDVSGVYHVVFLAGYFNDSDLRANQVCGLQVRNEASHFCENTDTSSVWTMGNLG